MARLRHPAVQRVLARATGPDAQQAFASVTSFMEELGQALAVASADAAPVADAVPAAAAPAAANPPSSLTQQFFAEGEKQDLAHAVEDDGLEQDDPAAPVGRLPRNRAQIAMATVLAFGTVGIIVGTFVSLSTARDASPPVSPVIVQRPADVPVSTPRAPADARAAAARTSGAPGPAYRERSHQGRTAAPRARFVEPPRFLASPGPSAGAASSAPSPVTTPSLPVPAPAVVPAPPTEAPAPAPTLAAPEDLAVVNEADVTQPSEQTEGEAATTE